MSSGLKKYGSILVKGSLAVSLANATTKFVGFLLLPLFTYYLSPDDYGTVAMVSLVVTFLNLFYNPGMISATMRLYHATDSEAERKELIGSAHRFFLFFPIIFILIGLFFGPQIFRVAFKDFAFYPYGFLSLVLAFFSQPKRIWISLMTLQYKVHITAVYSVISVLLGLGTTALLVIVFKMGAMGKVIGMFPTVLIFFVLSFVTVKKYTAGVWSLASIKKQLYFGFPLIIAIWSYEFLHVADRYILERMTDINSVGIYTFAYHLAELPIFLVLGVKQLWNPVFYETMNQKDYSTVSKLINYFITGLTIINMIVLLFSKELILLVINERYFDSIPIIGPIIIGVYFNGLLTISNSVLAYKNKFRTTSLIAIIATIINIGLNIWLIPVLGIMGCAVATMIAYFVYFIIGMWHQRHTLKELQSKTLTLVPLLIILMAMILNYLLILYFGNNLSWIEFLSKVLFVIFSGYVFSKFNLIGRKEFLYAYIYLKKKIIKN